MSGLLPLFLAPLIHLGFTGPIPSLPGTLEYLSLAKNCLTGTMATLQRPALLDLRLTRDFQLPERQPPPPAEPVLGAGPGSGVPEACNTSFTGIPAMVRVVPQEFVDAIQHNYIPNINPLPTTCTFCIQYNCLSPPQQSSTSGDKHPGR
ncbi:hypothetical protein SELMODRAFT_426981 [Selaginella moellendorffii]|uniref:Leucine-rich repeat-containing N-terminal plant-type domain-containing protein n=1 Tax=Selaginella moellendorffii TaxID=88036 RepID=D8SY48_SELML|nr:hypothetical protein SELMODRAFT_426981 [Selaginella moellendorffii]